MKLFLGINTVVPRKFLTVIGMVIGLPLISCSQNNIEPTFLPDTITLLAVTPSSHPLVAADHQQQALALEDYGYVEEEYLVSGTARVFDWPSESGLTVLTSGPYTTRILVRRPKDNSDFSGIAILEPFNPSTPVDLPIMWAQSHLQFMADGHAWVGMTIKPNTLKSLQRFDPKRYAALAMPHPPEGPVCAVSEINPSSQPTTPADETGLAWDMLSQTGALLKSTGANNPLSRPAQQLFMTGQSQTAGYARTYASFFATSTNEADGSPLFDAYLYSGSPPWQVPVNQCAQDFAPGDPRLLTTTPGVPVIELFAEGDIGTNLTTRRDDADTGKDLFRRYEIAGAAHVDPWEALSFASAEDMIRATGRATGTEANCSPKDVEASDFPIRYAFNSAWRNLEHWVIDGVPAPKAARLQLADQAAANTESAFDPITAFQKDQYGNAVGGLRSPYIDVPTARWVGAKTGPDFGCIFEGYKFSFGREQLQMLYPSHADYVEKVTNSAQTLEAQGWLTAADGAEIIEAARAADIP